MVESLSSKGQPPQIDILDKQQLPEPDPEKMIQCIICHDFFPSKELVQLYPCPHAMCHEDFDRFLKLKKDNCPACTKPIEKYGDKQYDYQTKMIAADYDKYDTPVGEGLDHSFFTQEIHDLLNSMNDVDFILAQRKATQAEYNVIQDLREQLQEMQIRDTREELFDSNIRLMQINSIHETLLAVKANKHESCKTNNTYKTEPGLSLYEELLRQQQLQEGIQVKESKKKAKFKRVK